MHGTWPYLPTPRCAPAKGTPSPVGGSLGTARRSPEFLPLNAGHATELLTPRCRGHPVAKSSRASGPQALLWEARWDVRSPLGEPYWA